MTILNLNKTIIIFHIFIDIIKGEQSVRPYI